MSANQAGSGRKVMKIRSIRARVREPLLYKCCVSAGDTSEIEPVAAARCSNTAPPSAGFKLALGGLTPKLRKALDENASAGPFGPPPFG